VVLSVVWFVFVVEDLTEKLRHFDCLIENFVEKFGALWPAQNFLPSSFAFLFFSFVFLLTRCYYEAIKATSDDVLIVFVD
jgi:hypothetical protein